MPNRRAAALTMIAVAGSLLLTGCTKPLPEVAMYANGQTVRTGPSVFCYPGQSFEANECVTQRLDAPQVTVETLDRVSVDVPLEIADGRHLWVQVARGEAEVNGRHLVAGDGLAASDETAFTFRGAGAEAELLVFDLA